MHNLIRGRIARVSKFQMNLSTQSEAYLAQIVRAGHLRLAVIFAVIFIEKK